MRYYPGGGGIPSCRQITRARKSSISRCRGTVACRRVSPRLTNRECRRPYEVGNALKPAKSDGLHKPKRAAAGGERANTPWLTRSSTRHELVKTQPHCYDAVIVQLVIAPRPTDRRGDDSIYVVRTGEYHVHQS